MDYKWLQINYYFRKHHFFFKLFNCGGSISQFVPSVAVPPFGHRHRRVSWVAVINTDTTTASTAAGQKHEHELWPGHKAGHIRTHRTGHKCDTNVTHTYWFRIGPRGRDEVGQTTYGSSQLKTKSGPKLKGRNRKPKNQNCNRTPSDIGKGLGKVSRRKSKGLEKSDLDHKNTLSVVSWNLSVWLQFRRSFEIKSFNW